MRDSTRSRERTGVESRKSKRKKRREAVKANIDNEQQQIKKRRGSCPVWVCKTEWRKKVSPNLRKREVEERREKEKRGRDNRKPRHETVFLGAFVLPPTARPQGRGTRPKVWTDWIDWIANRPHSGWTQGRRLSHTLPLGIPGR